MSQNDLDNVWQENPSYIRRFYDNLKTNEKLCQEVSYTIKTELNKTNINIAQITSRVKTLESFCEKITRKKYPSPFDDVTDFAGVRIVYLYSTDRAHIEKIIEDTFDVIEKVDKTNTDDDKFGYGALHYLIKIRSNLIGARYDELREKTCEIQIRTILQDAWALVAHHLSYKQESDIPKELRRKLNALSGLFETADDQFESIRHIRTNYQEKLQPLLTQGVITETEEANVDSLNAYLSSRFPDRRNSDLESIASLLDDLKSHGFLTLHDIDSMINAAIDAVLAEENKYPPMGDDDEPTDYASVGVARVALCFMSEKYLSNWSDTRIENVNEFRHLIKKPKRPPTKK